MMREELNDSLKKAMLSKDKTALSTIRLILAALKDRDIQARTAGNGDGVNDDEILEMLQKMVRQRRDSMEMYEKGGRQDLVQKEQAEIEVIERFLPQPLSDEETAAAIAGLIEELEASSIKDMGRVMGALKERYAGKMDFGKASQQVKSILA